MQNVIILIIKLNHIWSIYNIQVTIVKVVIETIFAIFIFNSAQPVNSAYAE